MPHYARHGPVGFLEQVITDQLLSVWHSGTVGRVLDYGY